MEVVGSISSLSMEFEVEYSFIIPPCASVLAPLSPTGLARSITDQRQFDCLKLFKKIF
jgi:hypothetical protein